MSDAENEKWVQPAVKGVPPLARAGHSAVSIGRQMLIFGGESTRDTWLNDTYLLSEGSFGVCNII